jgi:phytoene synthase
MTPASLDEGLRAAFAKAEAREPIHRAAAGFVPMESRAVFMAWVALLEELRECVFELSDPRVTAVKSGWWAEELDGVARGAARHPLTRALVRSGGPWGGVGGALLAVASDDAPAADLEGAITALRPLAEALVRVEAHLFGAEANIEAPARSLAVHWLRLRLERGLEASDRGRVPLVMFARHGLRRDQLAGTEADALRRDWALQLHDALPAASPKGWAYPRLIGLHTDRRALRCAAEGRGPSRGITTGFLEVWQAWRCARNAALRAHPPATHTT